MEAMLHSDPMNMRITVHSLWNQNSKIPPEQFYGGPSPASASGSLTLHRMALDILSIPAMAAEVERLFAQCKRIIKDDRHPPEPDSIEALECETKGIGGNKIHLSFIAVSKTRETRNHTGCHT
jgi:hypothetical protein